MLFTVIWRLLVFRLRRMTALMAVVLFLTAGSSVFAQTSPPPAPASCTALKTPATADITNAILCMVDTVNPYGVLVTLITVFVPIMLVFLGGGHAVALLWSPRS